MDAKMKRHVISIVLILFNSIAVFAQTPKELYPSDFKDCERLIFSETNKETNEIFYCYNEYKNKQRYLRIIGLKEKAVTRNICLQLDVDPDIAEYLKIGDDNIRFVISGIEGYEDYYVDLVKNSYKVLSRKTNDEFWADFKDVPFGKEFTNTNKKIIVIKPYSMEVDNNQQRGIFFKENGQYFFETDTQKYTVLFTQFYNTYFLTLLKKSASNKYKYSNDAEQFYKTFLYGYKETPALSGIEVKSPDDYVIETDSGNNKIEYKPNSFFDLSQTPWAISSKSDKKIINGRVKKYNNKIFPIKHLVIVNGFVNAEKPYLYSQNARAKKILIKTKSFSFEAELEDTGNFQLIKLPDTINDADISIRILSSYEGSRYSDIVISGIYYFVPLD